MGIIRSFLKRVLPRRFIFRARQFLGFWQSLGITNTRKTRRAIGKISPEWRWRIDCALACPDNLFIPRVPDAGRVYDGFITMHNGIHVGALGYYGEGILNMLIENRGVHEPQEERAFAEILHHLSANSTMIEVGAYWGFYSLWFSQVVPDAKCFLIEPSFANLRSGQTNFRNASASAHFEQAYVGALESTSTDGTPVVTIDSFCKRMGIGHIAILHSDIQGAEANMLKGSASMLAGRNVDYLFISTHSNNLHYECIDLLKSIGYIILASADIDQTYSVDGLIVAKCNMVARPQTLMISAKALSGTTFPRMVSRC